MYDIIGDIHGHYDMLIKLLEKLGYKAKGESFHHEERKLIFTGDIINRGNKIRKTINLIRNIVESGDGFCILGNHELNAILYSTTDKSGKSIRKHLPRYKLPLMKTLEEYNNYTNEYKDVIQWFRTLPLYLDLGDLRIAHGGWNSQHIETIKWYTEDTKKLKKKFLKSYVNDPKLRIAVNEIVKGKELNLPKDLLIKDNRGIIRRSFRIKWWENPEGRTFSEIAFGNRFELPNYSIPKEIIPQIKPYHIDEPPIFLGHYCLNKGAKIFQGNICCIDTCVVRSNSLTAYRWSGEKKLKSKNIIYV